MGKEKLVYILNPDGLTESIFVAKGEPNEGQYRGKRFTKAGWKAEKKRLKEDLLKQSLEQVPQHGEPLTVDSVEERVPEKRAGDVKTWEEYSEYSHTETITVVPVETFDINTDRVSSPPVENVAPTGYDGEIIVNPVKPDMKKFLEEVENVPEEETIVETLSTKAVYVVGDVQGIVVVLHGETMKPLHFDEHIPGFASQREITTYLTFAGYININVDFVDTDEGTFFTATAEHVQ